VSFIFTIIGLMISLDVIWWIVFARLDQSRHRARRGLDFYGRDDGRIDRRHRGEIVAR